MRATAVFLMFLGHLALGHGWTCTPGPALNKGSQVAQVDASLGQVVATDTNRQAYFLSGSYWKALPYTNLKHVSVGPAGIWGIDVSDRIFQYIGGSWAQVSGGLMQADAGGNGFAVGVGSDNKVWCLPASPYRGLGSVWTQIPGGLKYFSCGPYGCWGVNSARNIFFNPLQSSATCSFSGWKQTDGLLDMIEVGTDGQVFGVNHENKAFARNGITQELPEGTGWEYIPCLGTNVAHVSYDLGTIYAVDTAGVITKVSARTAIFGKWRTCTQGPAMNEGSQVAQVDASLGQVVATDTNHQAYFLSGSYWKALPYANLKHVSVGPAGIWGIDVSDRIFQYIGGSWAKVSGGLMQADAGGNGFAVGVGSDNKVWCLPASPYKGLGSVWTQITGGLKYFSCGPYGCWGVNSARHIFFNPLQSSATCSFSGWKKTDGLLDMIEVGTDGQVFGVNHENKAFTRNGITQELPEGTGWEYIPCLGTTAAHVSYDLGTIYAVDTAGVITKVTA